MIAHGHVVEEIASDLGADSWPICRRRARTRRRAARPRITATPASPRYPLGVGGEENGKFALELRLTDNPALLAEFERRTFR